MKVVMNEEEVEHTTHSWVGKLKTDEHTTVVPFTDCEYGVLLYSTNINQSKVPYWVGGEFTPCSITLSSL